MVTKIIAKGDMYEQLRKVVAITNTGKYTEEDIVKVTINVPHRPERHNLDMEEVMLAVLAKAKIICDDPEVTNFLTSMRYTKDRQQGVWHSLH